MVLDGILLRLALKIRSSKPHHDLKQPGRDRVVPDLSTGDLVWLNADTSMGGDPRDAIGADKRMAQLLEDFPRKSTTATTGTVKVDVPPEKPEQTKGQELP